MRIFGIILFIISFIGNIFLKYILLFCDMRGAMYLNVHDGCAYYARDLLLPIPPFMVLIYLDIFIFIVSSLFRTRKSLLIGALISTFLTICSYVLVAFVKA